MRGITITVSDEAFHALELEKSRFGSWKGFLITAVLSKLHRFLAQTTQPDHVRRQIKRLQRELGALPTSEPVLRCPHCFKDF